MNTSSESQGEIKRSSIMTEVKAAITIAVMLLANVIAITYWAATLSADMRNLQINVSELGKAAANNYTKTQAEIDLRQLRDDIKDHESRLRLVERVPLK